MKRPVHIEHTRNDETFIIRLIEPADNRAVSTVIRDVMSEYGVAGPGFSSEDAEIDAMAFAYAGERSAFLVVLRDEVVLGCGGMGPLAGGEEQVCEIRKMYVHPDARGFGIGRPLLTAILDSARQVGFEVAYLETLSSMSHARNLYRKFGFQSIDQSMGNTGHSGCNQYMALTL